MPPTRVVRRPGALHAGRVAAGWVALGFVAASAAACEGEDARPHATTERDSAGIAIVENAEPADTAADLRLASVPRVAIGESDGDPAYTFGRVAGAARLADGRIAVVDRMASELRFYDAAGRHLRSVGRSGDGPGEYREPRLLAHLAGDTLVVADQNDWRVTTLTAHGEVVARLSLAAHGELPDRVMARFADGTLLAQGTWQSSAEEQPGVVRVDQPIVRLAADGAVQDSLGAHFAFYRPMVTHSGGRGRLYVTLPYARERVIAATDAGVWVGEPERWELRRLGREAAPDRLVRLGRRPVPIPGPELERTRARFVERFQPQLRAALRALELPATYPPYCELRVGPGGELWVREYERAATGCDEATPSRWLVHDPDGRLLATVRVPLRARVLQIGAGHLLLAVRDESDVERVQLHDLPPIPPRRAR